MPAEKYFAAMGFNKFFNRSIPAQVQFLVGLFLIGMIGLAAMHKYEVVRDGYLQQLTANDQVKVELGYVARELVQELHIQFDKLFLTRCQKNFQIGKKQIDKKLDDLEKLLDVIQHGGTYTRHYRVNQEEKDLISRTLSYHNYFPGRINLGVIEIRTKIALLREMLDSIILPQSNTFSEKTVSAESADGADTGVAATLRKYKQIEPFFRRLVGNTNRIFLDGQREMLRIRKVQQDSRSSSSRGMFLGIFFVSLVFLLRARHALREIRRIIAREEQSRHKLNTLNNQLEERIARRTIRLEEEIRIRRQAEAEQRRQAHFLQSVMDALSHPFYVIDVDTYEVIVHNRAAREINPGRTDLCFRMSHRRQTPCSGTKHQCPLQQVKATGRPVCMEHIHYDKCGREIVVEVHGYPIFDANGKLAQMIEYSLDITKRKRAEAELAALNRNLEQLVCERTESLEREIAEREKFQLVVEQNPCSIIITDTKAIIEYVNREVEKISGYDRSELIGHNPSMLASGLVAQATYQDLWATLTREEVWHGEFINRSKKGEIYTENVLVAPLKNSRGIVTHYVSIKENISELKQAWEKAEAANRAKTEFLSRMSHELRTPLNAINGFSELLLQKHSNNPLSDQQTGQLLKIHTAGRHLLELINEILELSRIESGRIRLSSEPVSAADTIRDCVALMLPLAKRAQVAIKVDEASLGQSPRILADLTKFKQVLINLLSNAVKYNHPQGTVSISCREQEEMLCIEVVDTGIGIDPRSMDDLFVAFARLGHENSEIEGTGIGLTITKQLVERMGGFLEVESSPGSGSVFRVFLPAVKAEAIADPNEQGRLVAAEQFQGPATLLYIEDNVCNIQLLKSIIRRWPGFTLIVRKNAEKGLEAATLLKPDLILMDLHLPGMSGKEAFLELRKNPDTANIPVIALSADAMQKTIDECLQLGFSAYLTKPFGLNDLWMEIQKCLNPAK